MPGREIIARGRVQGVGYRWFVRDCALRFGITGYVQNRSDGTVLIVAVGAETALADFLDEIRQGHRYARVSALEIEDLTQFKDYEDFSIA
jgi:acylphosphatase